jgi:hypothetical protein
MENWWNDTEKGIRSSATLTTIALTETDIG